MMKDINHCKYPT